jgi:molybdopterin-guanine dinucleotide biosynthesis protein A
MDGERSLTAALLAGGRSTRMGTDKAFLRIGNELLIERQLRCLRETGAEELLISGRAGVNYSPFCVRVIYDGQSHAGPLAGLASILKSASSDMVLVLAVDLPEMNSTMLKKILSATTEESGCVPVDAEGFQPLAATYPRRLLPLAERHLAASRLSMREFVQASIETGLLLPLPIDPSENICFTNWNQPSDWSQPGD